MDILIPAWIDGQLQPVEKLQTHLRGLKHKAVSVFVMRSAETLLQRRAMSKYHTPRPLSQCLLHKSGMGRSWFDCAQRRLEEELGLADQIPVYRGTVEYRADVGGGMIEHEVVEIFTLQVTQITIRPNPEEVMDHRWQNLKDLTHEIAAQPEVFTPWLKIYLSQHAKAIFGA